MSYLDLLDDAGIIDHDARTALEEFKRQVANEEPLTSDTVRVASVLVAEFLNRLHDEARREAR